MHVTVPGCVAAPCCRQQLLTVGVKQKCPLVVLMVSELLVDSCLPSKPMAAFLQSTSEAAVEHDGVDELQDICWGWHGTYLQRSSQPSLYWNVQAGPHILQCSLHSAAGHISCCTIVDVSEHMSSFTPALQCHLTALVLAYYLGLRCR